MHEGVRVLDVLFEGERAVGVRSGRRTAPSARCARRWSWTPAARSACSRTGCGLRVWDPLLNKGAIWTYWKGAYRDTGRDEGATMVLQTADRKGWFWYIPLHDDLVSVGVVAPFDYLFKGRGPYAETYEEEVERCPAVKKRVSRAARARRATSRPRTTRTAPRAWPGDGWVLVGDAFGFLDPLYSSGVLLALRSGEMAADAICEGLEQGDTSSAQLGKWGPVFNEGVDRMRRLVCEYYEGFSFGRFVKAFPHLQGTVTDLLIGDVFTDRVDKVWAPMESLYPPASRPSRAGTRVFPGRGAREGQRAGSGRGPAALDTRRRSSRAQVYRCAPPSCGRSSRRFGYTSSRAPGAADRRLRGRASSASHRPTWFSRMGAGAPATR